MLSKEQYQAVFDWIPDTLASKPVTKIRASQFSGLPPFPCLIIGGGQQSTRARYNGSLLRTKWNDADEVYDETEGYNMYTTIRVDVEAYSEDDVTDLARALVTSIYQNRHVLSWDEHHVKFSSLQNSGYEANYDYPIQGGSGVKKIYRRVVEFQVEYELSWPVVVPPIREFDTVLDVDGATLEGQLVGELADEKNHDHSTELVEKIGGV